MFFHSDIHNNSILQAQLQNHGYYFGILQDTIANVQNGEGRAFRIKYSSFLDVCSNIDKNAAYTKAKPIQHKHIFNI